MKRRSQMIAAAIFLALHCNAQQNTQAKPVQLETSPKKVTTTALIQTTTTEQAHIIATSAPDSTIAKMVITGEPDHQTPNLKEKQNNKKQKEKTATQK